MIKFLASLMICLIVFPAVPANIFSAADEYDLVITNARIVDGTGNPWFRGSIGIKNGRIAKVGFFDTSHAKQAIDAKNQIVAPGFIDVHTHVEDIFENPAAENFIRMGVTSLITGNCGGSVVNVAKFLGRYKEKPLAVNMGTLIAHGSVRSSAMGLDNRAPTSEELAKMEALVDQGMKDGAVGFSTGLIYVPGTYAKTDEVLDLAKVAARYGGIYASHIRNEETKVVDAINEAINIGEQAHMPVEISHFKISARSLWGQSPTTIGLVKAARDRGLTVTVDQYAYTASSTSLDSRMPSWVLAGGRAEGRKRLADPATRAKVVEEMKKELKDRGFKDYSYANVADYDAEPKFNGKSIAEITQEVRGKRLSMPKSIRF